MARALRLAPYRRPLLVLVAGVEATALPGVETVRAAFAAGLDWLQLRDRSLDARAYLEWARPLKAVQRAAAGDHPTALLINRRVDLAQSLRAEGVHLGFDAVSPFVARTLLGTEALVGASTHAPLEIDPERLAACDYVHFAPVFAPLSKASTSPPAGLNALRRACERGLPVIAQGGIEAANVADVIACGARGVAVTGAILGAEDPGQACLQLRRALDAAAST